MHLAHVAAGFRPLRQPVQVEAQLRQLRIGEALASVGRRRPGQLLGVAALRDPGRAQRGQSRPDVDRRLGIGVRTAGVVDVDRRIRLDRRRRRAMHVRAAEDRRVRLRDLAHRHAEVGDASPRRGSWSNAAAARSRPNRPRRSRPRTAYWRLRCDARNRGPLRSWRLRVTGAAETAVSTAPYGASRPAVGRRPGSKGVSRDVRVRGQGPLRDRRTVCVRFANSKPTSLPRTLSAARQAFGQAFGRRPACAYPSSQPQTPDTHGADRTSRGHPVLQKKRFVRLPCASSREACEPNGREATIRRSSQRGAIDITRAGASPSRPT